MDRIKDPSALSIDGCSICQLHCADCKVQNNLNAGSYCFSKGYLTVENFKRLLSENPSIREIHFDNIGELFLNPDLEHIFQAAGERDVALFIPSGVNFNFVRPGVLEAMVACRTRLLVCALDGATPETYAIYRRGGNLTHVLANIDRLNRVKKANGSVFPHLKWQFIVFGHNEHELPLARAMAEERGMEFSPKMAWDSTYSPIRDKDFVMRETGWLAATREELMEKTQKSYSRAMCYFLWRKPRISWDGKVLGCCGSSKFYFGGNVFEDGLEAALNHPKIVEARRALLGKGPLRDDVPCCSCGQFRSLRDSGQWLTPEEVLPPPPALETTKRAAARRFLIRLEHFAAALEKNQEQRVHALQQLLFPTCATRQDAVQKAIAIALTLQDRLLAERLAAYGNPDNTPPG